MVKFLNSEPKPVSVYFDIKILLLATYLTLESGPLFKTTKSRHKKKVQVKK
jgi:hypothetical protein